VIEKTSTHNIQNMYSVLNSSLIALAVSLVCLIAAYYSTFFSMVSIWARSDTFAHGFLIFPISLWLIWRNRAYIFEAEVRPSYWGLPALLVLGFVWLLASYIGVLVVQQLCVVAMIPVLVFSILGWPITKRMMFPLFFLVFAVPMGEELVPYLIAFTADFTVAMIETVGIPVYREGTFFQLPTGNWSVVTACSGVRYLIASLTLGCLYAYLNYSSPSKRVIFIIVSALVPIVANGLRAFMIVMIGHYSDMKLATGVDHLIYGWLFFGVVIAIMFFIGSFWRDPPQEHHVIASAKAADDSDVRKLYWVGLAVLGLLIIWPLKIVSDQVTTHIPSVPEINNPTITDWQLTDELLTDWKPSYAGLDQESLHTFMRGDRRVQLFIGYYTEQRQDAELVNFHNVMVHEDDPTWRIVASHDITVNVDGVAHSFPSQIITSANQQLQIVYFYYTNQSFVAGKLETKWLEAKSRLSGKSTSGSIIAIATVLHNDQKMNDASLISFAEQSAKPIASVINELN